MPIILNFRETKRGFWVSLSQTYFIYCNIWVSLWPECLDFSEALFWSNAETNGFINNQDILTKSKLDHCVLSCVNVNFSVDHEVFGWVLVITSPGGTTRPPSTQGLSPVASGEFQYIPVLLTQSVLKPQEAILKTWKITGQTYLVSNQRVAALGLPSHCKFSKCAVIRSYLERSSEHMGLVLCEKDLSVCLTVVCTW